MKNEIRFGAPWATVVTIVTVVVIAILSGVVLIGLTGLPDRTPFFARVLMIFLPPAILVGTLPFMILGYVLRDDELLIERLGWANHVPLATVVSATADPDAIRGSIRLCGSGGLFGFFGWFRNGRLGVYRAYGTDPARCVVMKLTSRTIVVTPDDPQRFVTELDARKANLK
jgi:hypothetical protein